MEQNSFKRGAEREIAAYSSAFCSNSKIGTSNAEKTGIGLVNVRKRLDLLYGS